MKKILKLICFLLLCGILAITIKLRLDSPEMPTASAEPVIAPLDASPAPASTPSPTPVPTPTPTPTPETYTLSVIGDCTLWSNANYAQHPAGYAGVINGDYYYPFSNTIQYFENDDFTIANFECILSDKNLSYDYTQVYFPFIAPTEYANIIIDGGVDFVTTANNHIMDCYEAGETSTYETLEAYGIPFGKEGQAQLYTTDSGLVIGIYCSGKDLAPNKTKALNAIQQLIDDGAEYIICAFHWGQELYYEPNQAQIDLAHACIDAGADLIYGSHTHCLQPIEEYGDGLILYSMGNWTFGGSTMPSDPDTAIVQVELTRNDDGSVSRTGMDVIPCCVSSKIDAAMVKEQNYNDYKPTPYEEGSEGYNRVLSKLTGEFEATSQGADYSGWLASRAG